MTQPRHVRMLGALTALIVMVLVRARGDEAIFAQSARQTVTSALPSAAQRRRFA